MYICILIVIRKAHIINQSKIKRRVHLQVSILNIFSQDRTRKLFTAGWCLLSCKWCRHKISASLNINIPYTKLYSHYSQPEYIHNRNLPPYLICISRKSWFGMYIIGYWSFDKLQVAFLNNSREMFIVYQVRLPSCSFEHLLLY